MLFLSRVKRMALIGACAASFLIFKPANSDILPPNIDFGNILDFDGLNRRAL